MAATLYRIGDYARSTLPSSDEAARMEGYRQALADLAAVKPCSVRETVVTFENWFAAGRISQAQLDALIEHHGWERAP